MILCISLKKNKQYVALFLVTPTPNLQQLSIDFLLLFFTTIVLSILRRWDGREVKKKLRKKNLHAFDKRKKKDQGRIERDKGNILFGKLTYLENLLG